MRRKFNLLHLSDLHFGEIEGLDFKHKWPVAAEGLVTKCRDALLEYGIQPDFIVISGDLVCDGRKLEQYEEAKRQIAQLCTLLGVRADRLIVIPGNHDVDRAEADGRKRLSKFRGVLEGVYTEHGVRPRVPPESWDSHDAIDYQGWSPVVKVPDFPVDFITLYSCFTRKDKLVPANFSKKLTHCGAQLEVEAWNLFDRGFVSKSQLKKLSLPAAEQNRIRIAVVHHNLIPIPRVYDLYSELDQPDSNLLSNGMEVVEHLIENGVALILHGHRHQYALTVRSQKVGTEFLTVLGAPTAGLHHERYLGFNIIEIAQHNLGWGATIQAFKYDGDGELNFIPVRDQAVEIDLHQRDKPYRLLSNRHAVKSLSDKLLRSQHGPTILHFTAWANWHDKRTTKKVAPTSDGSPFEMVWEDEGDRFVDLTKILFDSDSPIESEILLVRDLVSKSKRQGYYDGDLVRLLREKTNRFRFHGAAIRENSFLSVLSRLPKAGRDRGVNYAIELFRLATDPQFLVTKAVHLCPCVEGEDARTSAHVKYLWLVNSALAGRGLNNCNLAWMPFCFLKGFNQTLVAIDDGLGGLTDPANIMIGWGPGDRRGVVADPELVNEYDYSVMVWNEDHPLETPLGDFGRDIRGLYERIIHPLCHRLLEDFPILKDGQVYWQNLEVIATILGFTAEFEEAKQYLADHSDDYVNKTDKTITPEKLNRLFRWILKQDDIDKLNQNNSILPWCELDRHSMVSKLLLQPK